MTFATSLADKETTTLLTEAERHYRREELIIPVIGHFSAGKSTFINTLLGEDVQAVGAQPTTNSFTEIWAPTPQAQVVLQSARQVWTKISGLLGRNNVSATNVITKESESPTTPAVRRVYAHDRHWPMGLVLVDTPGLEAADEEYDSVTWRYIGNADACIYFITVTSPLTDADRRAILRLGTLLPRVLIVLSKADMVDSDELHQVEHYITETLAGWAGPNRTRPTVRAVSCRIMTDAAPAMGARSGWTGHVSPAAREVVAWIEEEVILQRDQLRLQKLALDLQRAGEQLYHTLSSRKQADVERCQAELAATTALHEQAAKDANRYRAILEVLDSKLDLFAQARVQALAAQRDKLVGGILASVKDWLAKEQSFSSERIIDRVTQLLQSEVQSFYAWLAADLEAEAPGLVDSFGENLELPSVTIPSVNVRYDLEPKSPFTVRTHTSGGPGLVIGLFVGLAVAGFLGPLGVFAPIIRAIVGNSMTSRELDWRSDVLDIIDARLRTPVTQLTDDSVRIINEYINSIRTQADAVATPYLLAETQLMEAVKVARTRADQTAQYWMQKNNELNVVLKNLTELLHGILAPVRGGMTA